MKQKLRADVGVQLDARGGVGLEDVEAVIGTFEVKGSIEAVAGVELV